jgi:hypothetical protein
MLTEVLKKVKGAGGGGLMVISSLRSRHKVVRKWSLIVISSLRSRHWWLLIVMDRFFSPEEKHICRNTGRRMNQEDNPEGIEYE